MAPNHISHLIRIRLPSAFYSLRALISGSFVRLEPREGKKLRAFAGLVSLTDTPSPMGFLNKILRRPVQERSFLVLVVGYPAGNATVPMLTKKPLQEIATFL